MATVGDILFCWALLTAVFFRMMQYYFPLLFFLFLNVFNYFKARRNGERGALRAYVEEFKKVMSGETVLRYHSVDILPIVFLFTTPIAVAVSAMDSEYAGIAVLLSIASFGQLCLQQRADADYITRLERAYRWTLIVSAVLVMALSSGLKFLRIDVSGLRFSSEQKIFTVGFFSEFDWRTKVACVVVLLPVNWSRKIVLCVIGHLCKVVSTLLLLLAGRGKVLLTCETPNSQCAIGKLSSWLWSPDSHRTVMTLLLVSTMAGDLSWRPIDENMDEVASNRGGQ